MLVASLPTGKDKSLKDFMSVKLIFELRKHVFWIDAPCGLVIGSPRFEET